MGLGRIVCWPQEDLRDKTRANGLFSSTAVLFNNEQLRPFFRWFQNRLAIIPADALINLEHTLGMCTTDTGKADVIAFLSARTSPSLTLVWKNSRSK